MRGGRQAAACGGRSTRSVTIFSVAYGFHRLGKRSNAGDPKARIFAECFGDVSQAFDFNANVEIVGEDLVLWVAAIPS